jgi:hypothetical protein
MMRFFSANRDQCQQCVRNQGGQLSIINVQWSVFGSGVYSLELGIWNLEWGINN